MRRILLLMLMLSMSAALAQTPDNRSPLDKAFDEARAAQLALQAAEAKRERGVEPGIGERTGNATGGSRLNENYAVRQAALDQEVNAARQRYEIALKRWNDLK